MPPPDGHAAFVDRGFDAGRGQHPFRMVAGSLGLFHGGGPVGVEAREQNGRFHLGAGHGALPMNRRRGRRPCTRSGANLPSRAAISAPIFWSGSTTRPMGRPDKLLSPMSFVANGWPARTPVIRRIVVPEFPQ